MSVRPNGACSLRRAKSTAQNTAWTKLFWIYNGNSTSHSYSGLLSDDDAGSNYVQIAAQNSGTSDGLINYYATSSSNFVVSLPANTWLCIILVSDGTTLSLFYGTFGSTLTAGFSGTYGAAAATSTVYYLNSGFTEPASNLWSLGPCREWSVALTAGERAAEMNRLTPARTSNLIYSYYNRTVGEAGSDFSGNAANATITGILQAGAADPPWIDQNIVVTTSDLYSGFSPTLSHNLTVGSGNGRCLVAIIKRMGSGVQTFSNVTYNGVAMNVGPVGSAVAFSNRHTIGLFWLPDANLPATGSRTLSWTFAGAGSLYGWEALVLVLNGVNQTTTIGNTASQFTDNAASITSYSTNITTQTQNCMLLDYVGANDSNSAAAAGTGQTLMNDTLSSGSRFMVSRKYIGAPQATSMSWTFGASTGVSQCIVEFVNINTSVQTAGDNAIFFGMHF
jgi:hypothetical protein